MNTFLTSEKVDKILSIYSSIEGHLTGIFAKDKAKNLRFLFPHHSGVHSSVWQQERKDILRAMKANDLREFAALLNLHALNSAIEAARHQEPLLARDAETLRLLAEEARNFVSR